MVYILRGIRQGGLTSPALFNMFYQTLINKLCESNLGVIINNRKYNTLCYADDVILMSTTVTGLQSLINTAVEHITDRGLRLTHKKQNVSFWGKIHL